MRLFVKSVLAEEPWKYDSKVIPIPWRQSEEDAVKLKLSSGRLMLAYYTSNSIVSKSCPFGTFLVTHNRSSHTPQFFVVLKQLQQLSKMRAMMLSNGCLTSQPTHML